MKCQLVACFVILYTSVATDAAHVDNRVKGGTIENITNVPYQVAIYQATLPLCSGSIIDPKWILTNAYCIDSLRKYPSKVPITIRAGSSNQNSGGVLVAVNATYTHPDFNPSTFENNVGLLELAEPLQLNNDTIKSIQLLLHFWSLPVGASAKVAGWGTSDTIDHSSLLRVIEVFTLSQKSCAKIYGSAVTKRMFCAGFVTDERSICKGDNGTPLAIYNYQYGIASHLPGNRTCGSAKYPAVFTNVIYFIDFIWDTVKSRA